MSKASKKAHERRLYWYGHVMRREDSHVVRRWSPDGGQGPKNRRGDGGTASAKTCETKYVETRTGEIETNVSRKLGTTTPKLGKAVKKKEKEVDGCMQIKFGTRFPSSTN